MNGATKLNILDKLDRLSSLLLDSGTQEQLDIVEDIVAFDIAYDDSEVEINKLKIENEELTSKLDRYEKTFGNVILMNNR